MKFDAALMVMYPTVTMPADNDFHQNLPSVSEVLTSMASGVIVSDSEVSNDCIIGQVEDSPSDKFLLH